VDKVTHGFNYFLDTGNLNIRRFKVNRVGVAQVLVRLSYVSAVGMLSRLQSQFEKSRKVSGPRSIQASSQNSSCSYEATYFYFFFVSQQASQYGIVCPSDTPEGEGCGLTKNLALLCHLTEDASEDQVRKLLTFVVTKAAHEVCTTPWTYPVGNVYTIFVNGSIFGYTKSPRECARIIRQARRSGTIDKFISAAVRYIITTYLVAKYIYFLSKILYRLFFKQ
jgi:DNA-directed RNA polymerase III subunit RPC2